MKYWFGVWNQPFSLFFERKLKCHPKGNPRLILNFGLEFTLKCPHFSWFAHISAVFRPKCPLFACFSCFLGSFWPILACFGLNFKFPLFQNKMKIEALRKCYPTTYTPMMGLCVWDPTFMGHQAHTYHGPDGPWYVLIVGAWWPSTGL